MTTVNVVDAPCGHREEPLQEFDYLTEEDYDLGIDGKVPLLITSASLAQYYTVNFNIPCICTGLDHKTMQRFWLFIITIKKSQEVLDKYNKDFEDIRDLFE
ncbi:hypothetical protein [Paenibacillus macquariensis]|uniref:Tyrosine-protein phosphatase domain-containing protein n=1 Tax=Paenibacillus macquariensis TaxID=948756 RepID=A0ABY1JK95_9BACL|nr:hypothetical protein [Paenibacillus macquariensis]MEC0089886.1 hypothetical protein [Paenibacillus macquariensis]OAB30653.1 hypothetical protein PMSM_21110 [Paenibacillus macquariensis subsp. macquariensis]SIQ33609.1 hypothetical protein SAMN05421578_101271 [Paenibacillus macquariensis]